MITAFYDINNEKKYDPDSLPPIVLKIDASKLAPFLGKLFQQFVSTLSILSSKRVLFQSVYAKG